jgi:hypothetical protein
MLADGGEAIADLAVLRNQADLFGPVAADSTAWRVLSDLDGAGSARLRTARAEARELAWAQAAETCTGLPGSMAAGQPVPGLVLDLDASIVICHSQKQGDKALLGRLLDGRNFVGLEGGHLAGKILRQPRPQSASRRRSPDVEPPQ